MITPSWVSLFHKMLYDVPFIVHYSQDRIRQAQRNTYPVITAKTIQKRSAVAQVLISDQYAHVQLMLLPSSSEPNVDAMPHMQASEDLIRSTIENNKVAVFSKEYCPYCSAVSHTCLANTLFIPVLLQ